MHSEARDCLRSDCCGDVDAGLVGNWGRRDTEDSSLALSQVAALKTSKFINMRVAEGTCLLTHIFPRDVGSASISVRDG